MRDQIAYITSQFISFQQLQRPLLVAFENLATTAVKLSEIEQEAALLRTALVRLRHKPSGDPAHAGISGKNSPVLQALKRRAIARFLKFVTQSY